MTVIDAIIEERAAPKTKALFRKSDSINFASTRFISRKIPERIGGSRRKSGFVS